METVEVLIKIPKDEYEEIKETNTIKEHLNKIDWAVRNGTVLPKGHGRLVDAEKIAREVNRAWTLWEKKGEDCYLFADVLTPLLVSQQTVIEADKAEREDKKNDI